MIEPTHIKHNELMFYFDENLDFKGINKLFSFFKLYKKIKSACSEVHIVL